MSKLSDSIFVFAHGAGAGMDSDFMLSFSKLLESKGLEVKRFDFPYMKLIRETEKRRPPDRMPKLLTAYKNEIESLVAMISANKKIYIGGKSMGGRVASLLATESSKVLNIRGIICLGFPFHPPKNPENYRGEHLADIDLPTLILQGERDPFGSKKEMINFDFSAQVSVSFLVDGDHSFKPRIKSGVTLDDNLEKAADQIIHFIGDN